MDRLHVEERTEQDDLRAPHRRPGRLRSRPVQVFARAADGNGEDRKPRPDRHCLDHRQRAGARGVLAHLRFRLAQAAMGKPETKVGDLCAELGVTRQTLYRHVTPDGQIRPDGEKLLGRWTKHA